MTPDPILASLVRLHSRLDRIESRLDEVDRWADQATGGVAAAVDTADQWAERLGQPVERLEAGARVFERVTRPEALAQIEAALERLDRLPATLALLDRLPGGIALATGGTGAHPPRGGTSRGRSSPWRHATFPPMKQTNKGLFFAADLLLRGGLVWDGTGAGTRRADVLVQDGRIVAVGVDLSLPEGARVLDVPGHTLIPGLVDSHVHISMDPGRAFRDETPSQHAALLDHHLAAYLACGVTTILDPAITPEELELVRRHIAAGAPAPRFETLGTPLSPLGGYPAIVIPTFPTVAGVADIGPALDRVVSQRAVGVKTTVEPGFGPHIWAVYTPEEREAIRAGAAQRGLTVYAHAMSPEHQRVAIDELGATVIVHPPSRPSSALVAGALSHHVYEMSTLAILDGFRSGWEPERFDDPLVRAVVPAEEIATASDPANIRGFQSQFAVTNFPHFPPAGLVRSFVFRESTIAARIHREMAALRQLAAAGVPIVMGSDSGNWPVILSEFHGPTSLRELHLLRDAGFSASEVLTSATLTPARMMGIDAEQGTIEPGRLADLVVVPGDPTLDLDVLRHIAWTVRAGDARTPAEWIAAAGAPLTAPAPSIE